MHACPLYVYRATGDSGCDMIIRPSARVMPRLSVRLSVCLSVSRLFRNDLEPGVRAIGQSAVQYTTGNIHGTPEQPTPAYSLRCQFKQGLIFDVEFHGDDHGLCCFLSEFTGCGG